MQTFIPTTKSFADMAKHLDNKRLNKQALEGWQIMMVLLELDPAGNHRDPKGWRNHPAVKMWRGHERALYQYVRQMVKEWQSRGYNSTIGDKVQATILRAEELGRSDVRFLSYPPWMTDAKKWDLIAQSHRVALLHKDYDWYSRFEWAEDTGVRPPSYQYLWPDENNELILGTLNVIEK
jgi:hypothetical protein